MPYHLTRPTVLTALCLLLSGCATSAVQGTAAMLDSVDLQTMTDQMAMSIIGDARVQQALAGKGKLRVVVQPVENYMTAEVLPAGPAEAFTARVRALLARHSPDKFTWVMNRDAFYRLRRTELEQKGVDLGPAPDAVQPEFALTARFDSLAKENQKIRTSDYLCTYDLTSLQDRSLLWTGQYAVKKTVVKGFLD